MSTLKIKVFSNVITDLTLLKIDHYVGGERRSVFLVTCKNKKLKWQKHEIYKYILYLLLDDNEMLCSSTEFATPI